MTNVSDCQRKLIIRSQLHTLDDSPGVLIAVQDTGIGVAEENIHQVFDAFYTTKTHGLGMGLPISRSIIEAHGGRLWATRNTEHGMTVQFALPGAAEP
jgi:signal transduction histidine kinase